MKVLVLAVAVLASVPVAGDRLPQPRGLAPRPARHHGDRAGAAGEHPDLPPHGLEDAPADPAGAGNAEGLMPTLAQARRFFWMAESGTSRDVRPAITRFTITSGIAGQGYWYNQRSGFDVGSVVGSVVLADVGTINRFGITTGDVLINRSMQLGRVRRLGRRQPRLQHRADVPGRDERSADRADVRRAGRKPRRRLHPLLPDSGAAPNCKHRFRRGSHHGRD